MLLQRQANRRVFCKVFFSFWSVAIFVVAILVGWLVVVVAANDRRRRRRQLYQFWIKFSAFLLVMVIQSSFASLLKLQRQQQQMETGEGIWWIDKSSGWAQASRFAGLPLRFSSDLQSTSKRDLPSSAVLSQFQFHRQYANLIFLQ